MPTLDVTTTAEGVADFDSRSIDLQLHQNNGRIASAFRVVNAVSYMQFPPQIRSQLHIPTPWVAFDLSQLMKNQGSGLNANTAGTIHDTLAFLEQSSGGVISAATATGHEQVRGARTTRYELTIDIAKLREKLRQAAANPLFAGLDVNSFDMNRYQITVWIDNHGLLRRERIRQHGTVHQAAGAGPIVTADTSSTTEYYDFGIPVSIAAPPPSTVTTLSSLNQLTTR